MSTLHFDAFIIDVWGNAEDGWEQNDYFPIARNLSVIAPATDADILTTLQVADVLTKNVTLTEYEFEWFGDDRQIDGELRRIADGKPILQLRHAP